MGHYHNVWKAAKSTATSSDATIAFRRNLGEALDDYEYRLHCEKTDIDLKFQAKTLTATDGDASAESVNAELRTSQEIIDSYVLMLTPRLTIAMEQWEKLAVGPQKDKLKVEINQLVQLKATLQVLTNEMTRDLLVLTIKIKRRIAKLKAERELMLATI